MSEITDLIDVFNTCKKDGHSFEFIIHKDSDNNDVFLATIYDVDDSVIVATNGYDRFGTVEAVVRLYKDWFGYE